MSLPIRITLATDGFTFVCEVVTPRILFVRFMVRHRTPNLISLQQLSLALLYIAAASDIGRSSVEGLFTPWGLGYHLEFDVALS